MFLSTPRRKVANHVRLKCPPFGQYSPRGLSVRPTGRIDREGRTGSTAQTANILVGHGSQLFFGAWIGTFSPVNVRLKYSPFGRYDRKSEVTRLSYAVRINRTGLSRLNRASATPFGTSRFAHAGGLYNFPSGRTRSEVLGIGSPRAPGGRPSFNSPRKK